MFNLRSLFAPLWNGLVASLNDWLGLRWKVPVQSSCSGTCCVQFPTRDLCGAGLASHIEPAHCKQIRMAIGKRKIMQRALLFGVSDLNPPTLSVYFIFDRQHLFVPRAGLRYLSRGSRHQHWCANPKEARIQGPNNLQLQHLQWSSYLQSTDVRHLVVSAPHGVTTMQQRQLPGCLKIS